MCQLIAASCICDPVTETIWPIQSRRKSRCRSEEKADRRWPLSERLVRSVSAIERLQFITAPRLVKTNRVSSPVTQSDFLPARLYCDPGDAATKASLGDLKHRLLDWRPTTYLATLKPLTILNRERRSEICDSTTHQRRLNPDSAEKIYALRSSPVAGTMYLSRA